MKNSTNMNHLYIILFQVTDFLENIFSIALLFKTLEFKG